MSVRHFALHRWGTAGDSMSDSENVNASDFVDEATGGLGGRYERAESGLTKKIDERLTLKAAAWQSGRWDTGVTLEELERRIAERGGQATLKEAIALKAFQIVRSKNSRVANRGMRAGIQMERQNQIDQLAALNAGNDPQMQGAAPAPPEAIASAMDGTVPSVAAG